MARDRIDNRREWLQLAHVYDPAKHGVAGWFLSEKLDGQRCFWDGGLTRGLYCHEVPWANTAKDGIRVNPPKATGLWSRYGKAVQAPMSWLDKMPPFPLDGELYIGRGTFQTLMSTCRKLVPDEAAWADVKFHAFDLPDYSQVFRDGEVRVPNFEKKIAGVAAWLHNEKICKWTPADAKARRFESVVWLLAKEFGAGEHSIVRAVPQEQLPFRTAESKARVEERLNEVVAVGGEGLVLRNLNSTWEPQRTWDLLKCKPFNDCEVKVRGFIWGRETDKGSKLLGMMGAMIVDFKGKRLELSGFTDEERIMVAINAPSRVVGAAEVFDEGRGNAGKEVDVTQFTSLRFPIGSTITIRYRELTNDQLPKEARYWRPRPEES